METNYVKIYMDLNKSLCRTMTIKSEITADLMNTFVIKNNGSGSVDLTSPNTWKYYLNISGEYHFTDEVMYITSLDTLQTIPFNKNNLNSHSATREAYKYGTRYYYNLVNKYPNQQLLIDGIIYPSDIQTAVEARDGTILSYPSNLVEEQEISLISRLQSFIYNYNVRWDVKSFNVSDDYYAITQKGIFYLNLLTKLLNIRLSLSKTNEAHSFHIKNYLASHNGLDKYMPFMTKKQVLFLYRNLLYIESNAGKSEVFKTLIDILLTERNIPLSEYSIRQLIEFDQEYYSKINIRRKALNDRVNTVEQVFFEPNVLYDKESNLSYDNQIYYELYRDSTTLKFKNSKSSALQSKDLESSMIDYNDAIPDPYSDVLLREWAYNALKDRYVANISIIDPITLNTVILSAKDAFIYMYYLSLSSIGITVVDLPVYLSLKHRKITLPTPQQMLSLVDNDDLGLIDIILNNQPVNSTMVSVFAFNDYASKVYEEAYKYWFIEGSIGDMYDHLNASILIGSIYEDELIELPVETLNMSQWLSDRGLSEYNMTYNNANDVIFSIFEAATGHNTDKTKVIANIQRAMIEILTVLKSYTTQTIIEINDSGIKIVNWADIRPGNIEYTSDGLERVTENINILDSLFYYNYVEPLDNIISKQTLELHSELYSDIQVDVKINTSTDIIDGFVVSLYDNINLLDAIYPDYDYSISSNTLFIGFEQFVNLTNEEQLTIPDIYN